MTILVFTILSIASIQALSAPTYRLGEICHRYSDDTRLCRSIPFCSISYRPAQSGGCHARPEFNYLENACVNIDPSLCGPATGCQLTQPTPAQSLCVSNREVL